MIAIQSTKCIAIDSPDHLYPHGAIQDNSVNPLFNRKLYELIPAASVRLLDLGCAGGGLVESILNDGGFAYGIDGSDVNKKSGRAAWSRIPECLGCADVGERFDLLDIHPHDGGTAYHGTATFNVICAWEFLEHIPTKQLKQVARNIKAHLAPNGFVIGSISQASYVYAGHEYHATVQPRSWWELALEHLGFKHRPELLQHFGRHTVRGPQDGRNSFVFAVSASEEGS